MQAILFQQFSSSMANTVIFFQGTNSLKSNPVCIFAKANMVLNPLHVLLFSWNKKGQFVEKRSQVRCPPAMCPFLIKQWQHFFSQGLQVWYGIVARVLLTYSICVNEIAVSMNFSGQTELAKWCHSSLQSNIRKAHARKTYIN